MIVAFVSRRMTSLPLTKGPLKSTPVWHRGSFRSGGMYPSISCPLLSALGHRPTVLGHRHTPPQKQIWPSPLWNWIIKLSSYLIFFSHWRTLRSFMFSKTMIILRKFTLWYKQHETFWVLQYTKILKMDSMWVQNPAILSHRSNSPVKATKYKDVLSGWFNFRVQKCWSPGK